MHLEISALEKIVIQKLVDLLHGVTPIGCKWIYKIKYLADGLIEKFIDRLVAKGYNQIEDLNYFDTYLPIVMLTHVRTVIALTSLNH